MDIVFLSYEGMTALDAVGPFEILSRLPRASVCTVSKQKGEIRTDSGLLLKATHSFSEIDSATILVIPGSGNATSFKNDEETLTWIKKIDQQTTWTASVCTGSLILGAAGLLQGKKATTHWAAMERLKTFGAIPTEKRVVEDGKLLTSSGVSAGIDMALLLSAKISGEQIAKALQLGIEYDPAPPFDSGSPKKASPLIAFALKAKLQSQFEAL